MYDIDFNNWRFNFECKNPERMLDDSKWRRTIPGVMIDGTPYLFKPKETPTISSYDDEASYVKNGDKNTTNTFHIGEQLISYLSFEILFFFPDFFQIIPKNVLMKWRNPQMFRLYTCDRTSVNIPRLCKPYLFGVQISRFQK